MLRFFIESFLFATAAGISAAVYIKILAYEPPLNWWFRIGQRYEDRWFYPPIWGCVKCIAGQIALWSYLLIEVIPSITVETGAFSPIWYPSLADAGNPFAFLFGLVFTICGAILVGMICARLITNLEKD